MKRRNFIGLLGALLGGWSARAISEASPRGAAPPPVGGVYSELPELDAAWAFRVVRVDDGVSQAVYRCLRGADGQLRWKLENVG